MLWTSFSRSTSAEEAALPGEKTVCLTWAADELCPSNEELQAAVEAILGRRVFVRSGCALHVNGQTQLSANGGWEANLEFTGSDGAPLGRRNLAIQDADCAALTNPIALVLALMVDTADTPATLKVPPVQPPSTFGHSARLLAQFTGNVGLLPQPAIGMSAGFGANISESTLLRGDSTFLFPRSVDIAGRGGQFWAFHAGASLCPTVFARKAASGGICGGLQAGLIRGVGFGLDYSNSVTRPYAEIDARIRIALPLFWAVSSTLELGGAVPLLRPRFGYLDPQGVLVDVFQPHSILLFGGIGFEMRAPNR